MHRLPKKLAPGVLVAWVFAWALLVLDPCCEAIAAAVHHGDESVAAVAHAHADEARGDDPHHTSQAPHCNGSDAPDSPAAPLVQGTPVDHEQSAVFGESQSWSQSEPGFHPAHLLPYHTPPPASSVYLLTQRFRI